MKFQAAILLPLCLTLSAWSQLTFTVPVVDKSDPASPLEISGTATFTEQMVANSVTAFSEFKINARNTSGKGIVLLLAYFDEAGPHGGGTRHIIQIDYFFRRHIAPGDLAPGDLAPGDSFALTPSRPERRASACCINPLEPPTEPTADIRVQYVQFADGSSFGEEATAENILATRSVILAALRRIDHASTKEQFLKFLAQRVQPEPADNFLEVVRYTEKNRGIAAARVQIHAALTAAEDHVASLRVVQDAER